MNSPLVSVIIPTFNRADLIGETVQSILNQTHSNLEVVIADDGSTDGTAEVVASFNDPRIIFIPHEHVGHPSVLRNIAIARSKGEYVAPVDSDDLWLPDKIERQLAFLDEHPEFEWCYCFADPLIVKTGKIGQGSRELVPREQMHVLMLRETFIPSPTAIIPREMMVQLGGFSEDPRVRFLEDQDLWLRLFTRSLPGCVPAPLAVYRRHENNVTALESVEDKIRKETHAILIAVDMAPGLYHAHGLEAIRHRIEERLKHLLVKGERTFVREMTQLVLDAYPKAAWVNSLKRLTYVPTFIIRLALAARHKSRDFLA